VEWRPLDQPKAKAEYELYDYESDPLERKNLAADKPGVLRKLKLTLATYPAPLASSRSRRRAVAASPKIAHTPLTIVAYVRPASPNGVVLAQGGDRQGYALHFLDGKAAFDVRIDGKVTRVMMKKRARGLHRLEATLDRKTMSLSVNGRDAVSRPSPGLIPAQPLDELSLGYDALSAAGDYQTPNRLDGVILNTHIDAGGPPPGVEPAMHRDDIEAGLKSHDRALYVKEGWIRDPYIARGPDDYFYLTGTTASPGDPREENDPYNSGLSDRSIVGWQTRVWRSRDLIDWQSLGAPFSLKGGIWYAKQPEAFKSKPQAQSRLWAPELHWLGTRWALVHTSPSPLEEGESLPFKRARRERPLGESPRHGH